MPTYDYRCDTCDETFEVFQSMTARRLRKCPDKKCDGRVTRLLGTGAGLIFKGSGFYETDYRSDSYKAGASAEKASTEKKSESGGESKKSSNSKKKDPGGKKTAKKKE